MSLKAWYPLVNGGYKNQGSCGGGDIYDTPEFTSENVGNLGTTTYSGGAIKWSAEKTSKIFNNNQLSIAFWIKPSNETFDGIIFGNDNNSVNDNNRKFSLYQYPNGTTLHWSWMNDKVGETFAGGTLTNVLPVNKWTHVAVAYNNPVLKIYINGLKKYDSKNESKDIVSESSSFAYETTVFHQNLDSDSKPNRYIQDLRVYDHCLSEYEIHQLALGLCCHYDFNQIKATNDILPFDGHFKNSDANSYGLTCRYNQNGVWSNGNINDYVGISENSLIFRKNSLQSVSTHRLQKSVPEIIEDHTYRLHCDYCVNGRIGLECAHTNAQGETIYLSSYSTEDVILEAPSANLHVFLVHNNSNEDAIFKGMYLEDITEVPSHYSDKSGFGNHLTISNNVAMTKDTTCKAGTSSGRFNGVDSYIALPQSCKIMGPLSYNVWAYMDNWSEYVTKDENGTVKGMRIISCTASGGYNIEVSGSDPYKIAFACHDGTAYKNINSDKAWSSLSAGWHMFTMTFDGDYTYGYLDGEEIGNTTKKDKFTEGKIGYNPNNYIFLGAEAGGTNIPSPDDGYCFNGRINNFRLYASCLSPEDVKDLYNCRMKISNNHNVYCSEFIESDGSCDFKENGQILMSNFTEGGIARLKIHSEGNNNNGINHLSKLTINKGQGNEQILVDAKNPVSKDTLDSLGVKFSKELSEVSSPTSESAYYDNIGENFIITFTPPVLISNLWLRRYYNENKEYKYINSQIAYSVDNEGDDNWVIIHKDNDYPEIAEGKYFYLNGNINSKSGIYNNKLLSCKEIIEE